MPPSASSFAPTSTRAALASATASASSFLEHQSFAASRSRCTSALSSAALRRSYSAWVAMSATSLVFAASSSRAIPSSSRRGSSAALGTDASALVSRTSLAADSSTILAWAAERDRRRRAHSCDAAASSSTARWARASAPSLSLRITMIVAAVSRASSLLIVSPRVERSRTSSGLRRSSCSSSSRILASAPRSSIVADSCFAFGTESSSSRCFCAPCRSASATLSRASERAFESASISASAAARSCLGTMVAILSRCSFSAALVWSSSERTPSCCAECTESRTTALSRSTSALRRAVCSREAAIASSECISLSRRRARSSSAESAAVSVCTCSKSERGTVSIASRCSLSTISLSVAASSRARSASLRAFTPSVTSWCRRAFSRVRRSTFASRSAMSDRGTMPSSVRRSATSSSCCAWDASPPLSSATSRTLSELTSACSRKLTASRSVAFVWRCRVSSPSPERTVAAWRIDSANETSDATRICTSLSLLVRRPSRWNRSSSLFSTIVRAALTAFKSVGAAPALLRPSSIFSRCLRTSEAACIAAFDVRCSNTWNWRVVRRTVSVHTVPMLFRPRTAGITVRWSTCRPSISTISSPLWSSPHCAAGLPGCIWWIWFPRSPESSTSVPKTIPSEHSSETSVFW
mmetsp:Transcript_66250/g.156976  ORF Transcript_66250/g.156976 Transcript_66250/m.156976 type:complete len:641 (+) Transcript_66250:2515-4437(+)